jgi:hypothetical protein
MIIAKRDRRVLAGRDSLRGWGPNLMDTRRALQKAAGAVSLAASLVATQPSLAIEMSASEYFLGLTIPMSGYVPPPGIYFQDTFLFYNGTRSSPSPSVNYHLVFNIAQAAYYLDADVLGGTFGVVATIPFLGDRNSIPSLNLTDDIASIVDTDYSAVLGWHAGDHNWCVVLTGFAPTGNYEPQRIVQTGLNRPALDIKGAYTYLSLQTGTEVSGALGMTFNALNTATDYQSGVELHFEWALNQHFPFGLAAGIGGYFYQQLSDDYGSGATMGPFRGRVAAVGPLLSYAFKAGAQEVDVSARWFHEFAAQNRVQGDAIFGSLSFRL